MNKIITMLQKVFFEIKTYWRKPKAGEYLTYKELSYYILGVSGSNSLSTILNYFVFSAGCILVGQIYELPLQYFALVTILGVPLSYLTTPINMLITDNLGRFDQKKMKLIHCICIPFLIVGLPLYFIDQSITEHIMPALPQILATLLVSSAVNIYFRILVLKKLSKKFGKFRPWILAGMIPCLFFLGLIIYLPFKDMVMFQRFWILHMLFSFYNIFLTFNGQVGNLANVISPSSEERSKIMSIGGFVFSLIPSIISILLPLLSALTGGIEKLETYRIVFPIFVVILSALTLFLALGVKEKVIIEEGHTANISFFEGAKFVLKNRNFLMLNISNTLSVIAAGAVVFNNIMFIYILRDSSWMGIYSGIIGTACIPGLLLSPWLIKKFGKKKIWLFVRVLVTFGSVLLYFAMSLGSLFLFIIIGYAQQLISMPMGICGQAMNADIWDELQYESGERIDGMTGIFGMLTMPIVSLAGLIVPAIYLTFGFTSDWNILYIDSIRDPIISVTIVINFVVAILSLIPMFFYKLTEKRHKIIVEELKKRADARGGIEDKELAASAILDSKIALSELGLVSSDGSTSTFIDVYGTSSSQKSDDSLAVSAKDNDDTEK